MNDDKDPTEQAKGRCPDLSWNDLAASDTRQVPLFLLEDAAPAMPSTPLSTERYTSAAFFDAEVQKMWPNVWQFAAREEEMLEPGAVVVYENAGRSYLLTRQVDGSVRAFHNVCLHRGRKLRTANGQVDELRCPYHAFTWYTDGSLKQIPCRWDFEHLQDADMRLPEAQVGRWQGYIFVKEAAGGPSLEEYLAPLPEHFMRWNHAQRYTSTWVAKVVPANWKATAEAFMEAFHVIATHPQIMPFTGDTGTKYNLYSEHVNLAITPFGITSPHMTEELGPQEVVDAFLRYNSRVIPEGTSIEVKDGQSARQAMAEFNRQRISDMVGSNLDHAADAELQDALTYNVFPNFSPWGGFAPSVVYRWRPWPDQEHTLMEVRYLTPVPEGKPLPPAVPMRMLGPDESWSSVLGVQGAIFDQDMGNLPHVQAGMKASKNQLLNLGRYQESRIRHFHQTLDKYLKP